MENQDTEQIALSNSSDMGSLLEFKQTVLELDSDLNSTISTMSPDTSVTQESEYLDDQFEGTLIFIKQKKKRHISP